LRIFRHSRAPARLPAGFSAQVDANGARVSTGRAAVDANDRKVLRVPVKALPAGT